MATPKKPTLKVDIKNDEKVTKVVKTVVPENVEPSPETRNTQPGDVVEKPVEVFEHIVTKEDIAANPELVEQGIKEGDVVEIPSADTALATDGEAPTAQSTENNSTHEPDEALVAKMQPYLKAYPNNKTFYVTTDGQVFLEANKGDAKQHQRTLEGELVTFSA